MRTFSIKAISDTHNQHDYLKVGKGDILFHSGDCTSRGYYQEAVEFLDWFAKQDFQFKIMIAGNHDWIFENDPDLMAKECSERGITLLNDSGIIVKDAFDPEINIKIWGSPVQPRFFDWAFNRDRGADIQKHWDLIPPDTEILLTHGPPYGILDMVPRGEFVGCQNLLAKILGSSIKMHIFGHIHEGAGFLYKHGKTFINASSLDGRYRPLRTGGVTKISRQKDGSYSVS